MSIAASISPQGTSPYMTYADLRPVASSPVFNRIDTTNLVGASAQTARGTLSEVQDALLEWYSHPERIEDDDIEAPSKQATKAMLDVVRGLSQQAEEWCALWTLQGASIGTGGKISLEFKSVLDHWASTVAADPEGTIEWLLFRNNRLVRRHPERS